MTFTSLLSKFTNMKERHSGFHHNDLEANNTNSTYYKRLNNREYDASCFTKLKWQFELLRRTSNFNMIVIFGFILLLGLTYIMTNDFNTKFDHKTLAIFANSLNNSDVSIGFNPTRFIEAITNIESESEDHVSLTKFVTIHIKTDKIEYLVWKPTFNQDKNEWQLPSIHTHDSLKYLTKLWKPTLINIQNQLINKIKANDSLNSNSKVSINMPLNFYAVAVPQWTVALQQSTETSNWSKKNSMLVDVYGSYCMAKKYLANVASYRSILVPRYYTDPLDFFEAAKARYGKLFYRNNWDQRQSKALFRGSLTHPWRYELFKIWIDFEKYYIKSLQANEKEKQENMPVQLQTPQYAIKYNLSQYMDIALLHLAQINILNSKDDSTFEQFNQYIIDTPILHRVIVNENLRKELYHHFMKLFKTTDTSDVINSWFFMDFEKQHENFKYVIHIDGWACAARLPKYLAAGFVVIWLKDDRYKPQNQLIEYWYEDLIPYQHYYPVQWGINDLIDQTNWDLNDPNHIQQIQNYIHTMKTDFLKKIDNLVAAIKYLQENDDKAKQIATNAYMFMKTKFTKQSYDDFTLKTINQLPIDSQGSVDNFLETSKYAKDWKLLDWSEFQEK